MKVAVVQGGPSVEAEVSRESAAAVAAALRRSGQQVRVLELDAGLAVALRELGPDVVFPVCHGAVGEDGSLQGLLEVLQLPYVGSAVLASALAMDKSSARLHFAAAGLPIAAGRTVRAAEADPAPRIVEALGPRVVVKPAAGGSALGVTRLELGADLEPLRRALSAAFAQGDTALVERFVRGDEVTCGVLDLGAAQALPPTRIHALGAEFYDFESRYAIGKSRHECPAPYAPRLLSAIQRIAEGAHRALGCRDLSRADFVVDAATDEIVLLEVNTMPGFTATSLFPEAAAAQGIEFAALCRDLASAAQRRGVSRRVAPAAFPRASKPEE